MTPTELWNVAPEYDDSAFRRLGDALRSLGYVVAPAFWGLAGSQEVAKFEATSGESVLMIESETYVGLTVNGPAPALDTLKARYAELTAEEGNGTADP